MLGPRIVVAGTRSGVGKTTVATGLMAALRLRGGLQVASAKVGPDFIDPGFHRVATGRPGRNLDVFLSGAPAVPPLAARAARGADVLVVEGVMGLFDGIGSGSEASTAHVAALLASPVLLVVDATSISSSIAAEVHGYDDMLRRFEGRGGTGVGGVVLNRVGSDHHEAILRAALAPLDIPVVGVLRRDVSLTWRSRHLGLVPAVEQPAEVRASVERLAAVVTASVDLDAVERLARAAPELVTAPLAPARKVADTPVPIAVVAGPAFSFAYPDNLERLEEAGADLCIFDPLEALALPPGVRGLYAGGGYPEVFVEHLADNRLLLDDVRRRVSDGLVTWAECGGLLWLCRRVNGHRLCGAIGAEASMGERITVGYRTASVRRDNPVAGAGAELRGHELHYSTLAPPGDALRIAGSAAVTEGGWAAPTMLASYLHLHVGADPGPAERFVATAAASAPGG